MPPLSPVLSVSSRCFPLSPCGVGTLLQESLPSYLTRLAHAHHISVAVFCSRELLLPTRSAYLLGRPLHLHTPALATANRLAILTSHPDVRALVPPYLSTTLSFRNDLRQHVAWCPKCFDE
jgi:hypothetical protein